MTSACKILVVDDEAAIRRLLRGTLTRAGYDIVEAADGRAALSALAIDKPDLVLLDLGLPDRDGLELVPLLKRQAALIVVSARDQTADKVTALDLGADDFVTKPFDTDELLARIRTSLRHRLASEADAPIIEFGALTIDLVARQVRRGAAELRLTPKEYGFLAELAKHPGRVLTHHQLLRAVWGPAHVDDVEYLRVVVRSLRQKLSPDGMALIRNEPGVGYRLIPTA